ncbi:2-oxoglutarate dehydrogenase complex dihydrolipoyllysine-residue succinyltransferase [Candidatus Persebacteraceae bacterium Df01]|jgi:2-oxoglutarate dehydrogenase E2 component (dihydrolipoamide succinyltransferase)|uniref:Dihydrolipoyllysine-residue succinyltransferase component of 2-oxoglutarate dehydrogenase complex n=1 Tax=Candidatus Doriopsillibacter californiensis TaxID=2970740 RepID=A0ABT7QKG5_9GAMM|nr:2-oxoglutarate dehydrogenase complex dihydrolipoyllysine-residue succinyltransferase [Candidatus Persebacteraceae bacterium Df01]
MIEIKVPELSESVSEAVLLDWQKNPGDAVHEGDILVSVETDKIVLEVYAPCDGELRNTHKTAGDSVVSGELLASIDNSAKPTAEPTTTTSIVTKPAKQATPAMPSAKKIAAEQGVDLRQVEGSGKGGRITKGDVLIATSGGGARNEQRVPMTKLRTRIAERLMQSQNDTASLTTFNEVNMQTVIDLRTAYRDTFEKKHGVKLGFMSFFVKAVVQALQQYPVINASVDGNDIVYHEYYDIGVAVGTPRGLVVPILKNAEHLSMADVEKNISDFGARAQTGALTMEEITGGTFSITNGGVFGSLLSTPIINPPQSAILGIHATKPRPIAENGEVVIRPMNYLALSYDHRVIDGREAVLFLVAVKEALENPARMLLNV